MLTAKGVRLNAKLYARADEVDRLRLEAVLSKTDLARRANISISTLWRVEHSRSVSPPVVKRLARALGVKPQAISEVREDNGKERHG